MKKNIVILFVCLFLVGCQATGNTVSEQRITVGGLFALTGYGAQWGAAEQHAAQLAISEANAQGGINGTPIVLISEDTQTQATGAINAYSKLVHADNVHVIIGPTWEASMEAVLPLATQDNVLVITPSSYDTVSKQKGNVSFSTYPPFAYQFGPLETFAQKNNITRFAVIANQETFSTLMEDIFIKQASNNNWKIEIKEELPLDAQDYRTQLMKVRQSGAQAIYAPMVSNQLGTLVTQAHELGITIPIYSIDSVEGDKTFANFGSVTNGVLFPSVVHPAAYASFEAKYRAAYGSAPESASAANAYDAMNLIISTMRSGARSTDEIVAHLHSVRDYPGVTGNITFTANGIIEGKEYALKTVRDGAFVDY